MLCAGAAAQGRTRGLNFFVWNFAWDRLASRLYAATATTFLMKMGYIHPAVSEKCDPQSLDPICGKLDKFLAHGQADMGQMGKWPYQCTTRGLDDSTELWMEKIRQLVTEIGVPQAWQPSARLPDRLPSRPPARPDRDDNTPPAGGLRGKKWIKY